MKSNNRFCLINTPKKGTEGYIVSVPKNIYFQPIGNVRSDWETVEAFLSKPGATQQACRLRLCLTLLFKY